MGYGKYGARHQTNALAIRSNDVIAYWWGDDLHKKWPKDIDDGQYHHIAETYNARTKIRRLFQDFKKIGENKVGSTSAIPRRPTTQCDQNQEALPGLQENWGEQGRL